MDDILNIIINDINNILKQQDDLYVLIMELLDRTRYIYVSKEQLLDIASTARYKASLH